jgi:hypothetical protein
MESCCAGVLSPDGKALVSLGKKDDVETLYISDPLGTEPRP